MEAFLKEFQHLKIQLEAIKLATRNFNESHVIGKGGFGVVYEGLLSHSKGLSMVALKRLNRYLGQGDPEFWKEILTLSRYTNKNLISLLGFCDEDGEKIIVYEHASNGSLDRHLNSTTLMWRQRLKICLAAARGLSYLHDPKKTRQRVLHRDIKSSNILLDDKWNAKVSDMGLSKIGPANQAHTFIVSNIVGTFGYIDPMYMQTGILTKESDVYSFGVVLFEVMCGRLCYENNNGCIRTLGETWKKSYKRKRLDEIIIQDLKQHVDRRSLKTFADIAYRCLKKSRQKRPHMYHVVEQLEIALRFQETFEEVERPMVNEQMSKAPVQSKHYMFVLKGITINELIELFGDICMWTNPTTTVYIHVLFILLVLVPEIILPTLFLYMFIIGILNFRRQSHPPYMKTKISQAQGLHTDKEPDTFLTSWNPDLVKLMYDRLRIVSVRIQTMMQSLMTWRDPRATAIFVMFCLIAAIVFYVTPFKAVATLIGMYKMRHPRFRNLMPSVPVHFFRRLPS